MKTIVSVGFTEDAFRRQWSSTALAAVVLAVALPLLAPAAERVWDGGARGDGWNDIGNWVGTGVPVAGDSLRFPVGALQPSNNNDFPAGTSFNALTYAGAGYTASGNEILLTGGLVVSHGAGNTILNLPIEVGANQTFLVSVAGANLFLNGRVELGRTRSLLTFDGAGQTIVSGNIAGSGLIIGGGAIRKNGPGNLYVLSHLTVSGSTTVNGGTLRVDGSLSNSAVTLNAGATLLGTGKVGELTVNSGGTVSPGGTSPDIFDSLGNVALNAGSTLNIKLNGTSVGINYDQLRVQGTVTVGGTLNVTAGFVAAVGDTFTIIDNDGDDDVVGTFAGLPEGAVLTLNGRPFKISYGARFGGPFGRGNDVTLEAVPALAVWDGEGNNNKFWSLPLNWVGNVLPMPGDDIQFANTGSGTLITSNDFPAGRVFGSMIFAGGDHLTGGNAIEVAGGIQLIAPGEADVHMPVGLRGGIRADAVGVVRMSAPVTLGAGQTFRADKTNSFVVLYGDLALENHRLTVDGIWTVGLQGVVSGTGELVKNGTGILNMIGTNTLPLTTVNGGVLNGNARATGLIVVNAGGTLGGGGCCLGQRGVQDVDVIGGTLAPSFGLILYGRLRMLGGATFVHNIYDQGANGVHGTYLLFGGASPGPTVLNNCNYVLNITLGTAIEPGRTFPVIVGGGVEGVFNDLPDGARFQADIHAVTMGYGTGINVTFGEPFFWDGGGSGNLATTAANWAGDFAPIPGLDLVFPANVSKLGVLNDFPAGTTFRSLLFAGPSYIIAGNSFRLTQGLTNELASGETAVVADILATADPFECRVANSSRLVLDGQVRAGDWLKTGTGTLRCQGNTTNGQTRMEVWAGELELAKAPGLNAISRTLVIGDGTNASVVTLLDDHQIADTADVTVRVSSRFDLNGNVETIDQLSGSGRLALSGRQFRAARLTVNSGNFSGDITGSGGLTKTGSDSFALTLTGTNTYSGPTILSSGTLAVDGVQPDSPIRLDGGLLRGRGQVGDITGNLGGVVQPGFSGAAFQNRLRSRDVAFNSTTTFRPLLTSVDPGFENSQLQVAGTVNLGGSALDIGLLFAPTVGRSFTILDNDGADRVTGTFAGLPEGAEFTRTALTWRITYAGGDGNDVVLTLVSADFRPVITSFSVDFASQPGRESVHLIATTVPRAAYELQRSSNLPDWALLFNTVANGDGLIDLRFSSPTSGPQRYYRLKLR